MLHILEKGKDNMYASQTGGLKVVIIKPFNPIALQILSISNSFVLYLKHWTEQSALQLNYTSLNFHNIFIKEPLLGDNRHEMT